MEIEIDIKQDKFEVGVENTNKITYYEKYDDTEIKQNIADLDKKISEINIETNQEIRCNQIAKQGWYRVAVLDTTATTAFSSILNINTGYWQNNNVSVVLMLNFTYQKAEITNLSALKNSNLIPRVRITTDNRKDYVEFFYDANSKNLLTFSIDVSDRLLLIEPEEVTDTNLTVLHEVETGKDISDVYKEQAEIKEKLDNLSNYDDTEIRDRLVVLEGENNLLRSQIPLGHAVGEHVHLKDSSNLPFEDFKIGGNVYQETRSGKNVLNLSKHTNTLDAGTTIINNNSYQCNLNEESFTSKKWKGLIELKFTNLEKNTNYVISLDYTSGFNPYVKVETTSVLAEKYMDHCKNGLNFNTGENETITIKIYTTGSVDEGINGVAILSNIQLEKETTKSGFEEYGVMPSPEYHSEIKACEGNISLKVSNKNIADINEVYENIKKYDINASELIVDERECIKCLIRQSETRRIKPV